MKNVKKAGLALLTGMFLFMSCNNNTDKKKEAEMKEPKLKEENVTYTVDGAKDSTVYDGYVVYDENIEGKRPAILVVHEWWGLNEYAKRRARDLAKLGYIAMALDMYGNGKRADNPEDAGKLAGPFYQNPAIAKPVFEAAMNKLKSYAQADGGKVAAIGYCFGGAQVLNMAKMGEDLKGVVSFHGNLTVVPAVKDLLKADVLVCHGAADPIVPQTEVDLFKHQMDSVGAKYTFKAYNGATHAFTNPDATANGEKFKLPIKYDAAADTASWNDMKVFFGNIFK
ncbi:MAG: dienelactone hydrolase family protein [Bacteroidetes bacterium]|nr:dienelactone hydrolase family protein [Bacteroidota bacterium]